MIDPDLLTRKDLGVEKVIPDPALPITTRTVSDAEARGLITRTLPVLIVLLVLFGIAFALYIFEPEQPILTGILAALVIGFVATTAWRAIVRRRRHLSNYRDPQISVEVRETGMTVRAPGHVHELPFAGAAYTPIWVDVRSGRHFWGIRLETPIGPLSIENTWFRSGRSASGAILRRIEAARDRAGPT